VGPAHAPGSPPADDWGIAHAPEHPRVGLVLGAGGVLGGAWLVGALDALARETGWDPGSADRVVGTSAGSMIGALVACGVPPWLMAAHSGGEDIEGVMDAKGAHPRSSDRSAGAVYKLHGAVPSLGPGSWKLALGSLARPYRHSPVSFVSAWLPRGFISTQPLKDTVQRALGYEAGWAPHPGYSAVACDYETGAPVAFGTPGAPHADLTDAVAASCAIPGFYHPVTIEGRRYVDGGMRSTSNLDTLAGENLDIVICLNPMSSLHAADPRTLGERLAFGLRSGAGKQLGAEARRLRSSGTDVVILQPTVHDLDAMGTNLMSGARRHEVIERATASVSEHLRECGLGERLAQALPAGAPALVRRPKGSPDRWPDLRALARARFAAPPAEPLPARATRRPRRGSRTARAAA